MVLLFAQSTIVPQAASRSHIQIILLGLVAQSLRLLRQARHVGEASRPAARAPAHETLLRLPMQGLRADEARLPLRVLRASLRRDGYGLRVLLICVVLFGAACFLYLLTEIIVATLFPVLHLAFRTAVARAAAAAFLAQ